eukprot:4101576-Pleurochrysis_carterae.AAC.1
MEDNMSTVESVTDKRIYMALSNPAFKPHIRPSSPPRIIEDLEVRNTAENRNANDTQDTQDDIQNSSDAFD